MPSAGRSLLAVTMGEPSGIGGEIALKAWAMRHAVSTPFFILDSPARLDALARETGIDSRIKEIANAEDAPDVFPHALPVLALQHDVSAVPGHPDHANAPAVLESIDRAIAFIRSNTATAMVTNPIHKETLYVAGFDYPGHTEYLADKAGNGSSVMMIASDLLKVVPVTIHLPLAEALNRIDRKDILYCAQTVHAALRDYFGIVSPRLAISGLNPHAGEGGHLGTQEIEIISPAIEELRRDGINVKGPLSADAMFHEQARRTYDAAICMYHDQALIPAKTLAFENGVNVTLGLSIIRTSPDHGTALDLAGTGRANPASLIAALNLAADMAASKAARAAPA